MSKHATEHSVAMSLLDRIKSVGDGDGYKNAVRRCIDNEYRNQSLDDKDAQQLAVLYAGVVELLEQGLKTLEMPMYS